jgi:predicted histone-like DNA-binding protein
MALDVKKEKRTLNYREDKKEVFVVTADRNGVIDTDKMAREIAVDTGARPAQVKMILETLTDRMVAWLEEGHGVRFGKLGSFLPSVRSKSADSADDAEVTKVRVVFYPNRELARRIAAININTVNDEKPASGGTDSGNTGDGGENTGGGGREFS